jgi:very-short-patch-repair endonuclease
MPRTANFDQQPLNAVLRAQHGVIERGQTSQCGMAHHLVKYRTRDGGTWQVLAPGVYLSHTGFPSVEQREMAALLYGGPHSVITGPAALRRHGIATAADGVIDLLVPADTRRSDVALARLHRTTRLPDQICVTGGIRYVLSPRAVADTVRELSTLADARALVAGAVQRGGCPLAMLAQELAEGPVQGSARFRRILEEVADGIRSSLEADLRDLIKWARLPKPMFNPRLLSGQTFLGIPDCWWQEAAVAVEVDSRAWHFSPEQWEDTLARHARLSSYGIIVLHFTPGQILTKRHEVAKAIRRALAASRDRSLPEIIGLPAR